jgi:hypothetical protein
MAELRATYSDADAARAAITALERHGVDANDIHFLHDPAGVHELKTGEATREVDMATTHEVGKRSFTLSLLLSTLGAVAGFVGGLLWSDGEIGPALMAAVGFWIVGGLLGFLYGGYSGLAVSEEWSDTFESRGGPATVEVHVADDQVIDLRERLESTHPMVVTVDS